MGAVAEVCRSSVGTKAIVAVSGLVLWTWVVLHVAGNLTLFSGPAVADGYAAALRGTPAALWAARAVLATAALAHVVGVVSLTRAARGARPRHETRAQRASTPAARTMRWGGAFLLGFVGYHLLHLTFGIAHPHFVSGRVYDNVVLGLRPAWVAIVYVAAAVLLGLHLFHGLWAVTRSLGLRPETAARRRRPAVAVVSAAVAVGFAAVPVAVVVGWLR